MQIRGTMYKCDRCDKNVFKETGDRETVSSRPGRNVVTYEESGFVDYGGGYLFLCRDCAIEYEKLMKEFMEEDSRS